MKRFAYLDIEATHTNWNDAEIIEIAFLIKDENGKDLDHFESLVKPTNDINEKITALTGITKNMINNAPEFHKLAQRIYEKLKGTIIVAHKIDFDFQILSDAFSPLGFELTNKKICTLELAQKQVPDLLSYSLESLCDLFYIKEKTTHRAMDDAVALSELHFNLRLLEGKSNLEERYLQHHSKIIDDTPGLPGVIVIKDGKKPEVFKSENLKQKLRDLLVLSSQNSARLSKHLKIELFPTASLIQAGLRYANITNTSYNSCIYTVKAKSGRLILKIGRGTKYRNVIFYTKTKEEANTILTSLLPKKRGTKFAYRDPIDSSTDILEFNSQLDRNIRKLLVLGKNYLICSCDKINGKYEYVLIRSSASYARFKTEVKITNPNQVDIKKIKFKNMNPREFMAFNHSLKWIKQQRKKTDNIFEIKESLFNFKP